MPVVEALKTGRRRTSLKNPQKKDILVAPGPAAPDTFHPPPPVVFPTATLTMFLFKGNSEYLGDIASNVPCRFPLLDNSAMMFLNQTAIQHSLVCFTTPLRQLHRSTPWSKLGFFR